VTAASGAAIQTLRLDSGREPATLDLERCDGVVSVVPAELRRDLLLLADSDRWRTIVLLVTSA